MRLPPALRCFLRPRAYPRPPLHFLLRRQDRPDGNGPRAPAQGRARARPLPRPRAALHARALEARVRGLDGHELALLPRPCEWAGEAGASSTLLSHPCDSSPPLQGGGHDGRAVIREHEWYFPATRGRNYAAEGIYKFNVLITSYQCLISDWEHFAGIRWRYVVVDEAHALKNQASQLQAALRDLRYDSLLLLTGTPLQNDVQVSGGEGGCLRLCCATSASAHSPQSSLGDGQELFSLLALLNPAKYPSVGDFVRQYGELRGAFGIGRGRS